MNSADVLQRLSMGEDSQTRFLPNLPDTASLAQELVALANGGGGNVYVGIDVRKGILGLTAGNCTQARRTLHVCATRHVQPPITIETTED